MGGEKGTTGHVCELPPEVDGLLLVIPGTGWTKSFRRWFRNNCLVSSTNRNSIALFHSKAALTLERNTHLSTFYWIIHPFSTFRTLWELIMCFVFLISFIIAPYTVSYNPELTSLSSLWVIIELTVDVFCFTDIILTFNSGIFDDRSQEVILNPLIIARRYVFSYFIFDLLSALPVEHFLKFMLTASKLTYHYVSLANLLRIARTKTLHKYIHNTTEMIKMGQIVTKVTVTTIFCTLFFHWMACICFLIDIFTREYSSGIDESWVSKASLWEKEAFEQYLHSFFHAVLEGNHVNYGHGAPTTAADMFFTCLLGMLGTIIFIYIVSIALQILYITNNAEFKYEEDTSQLKEFMRQKQLPEAFQQKLIELNEFKFQRSFFREKNILNSLPGQLQQEILIHSCRHLVENVSFFNNLSSTMLVRLVMVLKSEIYLKSQEIIKIRTQGDCMFFLSSGTIAVYSASGREVCHMQDGSHFGEMALLNPDRLRTASVVALEISEVYRLDRRDFVLIVAQFPDMVDQLKQIAAERQEQLQRIDV